MDTRAPRVSIVTSMYRSAPFLEEFYRALRDGRRRVDRRRTNSSS